MKLTSRTLTSRMFIRSLSIAALSCSVLAASLATANAQSPGYRSSSDFVISTVEQIAQGDLGRLVELGTWLDDWDGAFRYTRSGAPPGNTCSPCNPIPSTPLPAALPLYGAGLGVMGLLAWRRKRKAGTKPK